MYLYLILISFLVSCVQSNVDVKLTEKDDNTTKESDSEVLVSSKINVYIGTQSSNTMSTVFKLELDTETNSLTYMDEVDLLDFPDDDIRSMTYYNNTVYAGGRDSTVTGTLIPIDNDTFTLGAKITTNGASSVRPQSLGLCFLSNGNFISGGYNTEFTEYSGADSSVATSDTSGVIDINSISACAEGDNTNELYLIDYDAYDDNDGDIVYAVKSGSDWIETERFNLSSISTGSLFTLVKHTNGNLYAFPQNLTLAAKKPVICTNISVNKLSSCAIDSASEVLGSQIIQGAQQIPGSDDILYVESQSSTVHNLYRYNISTKSKILIGQLTTYGVSAINKFAIRGFALLEVK